MSTTERRIHFGVAASLDGYIAGPRGEADWIVHDPEIDFGAIWARFDTILVGRKTFARMVEPGQKAPSMPGVKSIVFSRTLDPGLYPGVTIVSDRVEEFVDKLKAEPGKDIWLFGGGELFASFAAMGLVDTVSVAVEPVMLGGGLPLFPASKTRLPLKLVSHRVYSRTGIVSLEYEVVRPTRSWSSRRSRR